MRRWKHHAPGVLPPFADLVDYANKHFIGGDAVLRHKNSKARKRITKRRFELKRPATSEALKRRWQDPAYRAARKNNPMKYQRWGIPDGMKKAEAMERWAEARAKARRFIEIMEEEGTLPKVVVPHSDEEKAKLVLEEATAIALSPMAMTQHKIAAIRTVLEWTKSKPVQKTAVAIDNAEAWLNAVISDNAKPIADVGSAQALPNGLRVLGAALLSNQNQAGDDSSSGLEPCTEEVPESGT